ncbi:uncharacterized protein F5891DRAFT_253517 [Suillus fuscotomentosus]|uniref:Uncharacterized protein n=1 Tax=Suillus fuscotomentosus TaxID=1912939 RepID=A0AAD4E8P7_9AGAM|nr:uncharacterized protein F5891DRAFT_253517 [Suillus fuscotomentosus]KAG1901381.1 hypothetical protein F5891DRAFT_253517 [Suillus fuscotomentosus]
MLPRKRHSGQSFGQSSSSSAGRSTPPPSPTAKQRPTKRLTLSNGTTADRVPAPGHSCDHIIPFSDNGNPGVSVGNILNGRCVLDSPEPSFKAGPHKVALQWPGYDDSDPRHITVNPNTKQELAVAVCTAMHKFYSSASKMTPSVKSDPWTLCSRVRLKDILLTSIHLDAAGVWLPEFYVLR